MSAKKPLKNQSGLVKPFTTGDFLPVENGGSGLTSVPTDYSVLGNNSTSLKTIKNYLNASVDPTVSNDSSEGYSIGSLWVNTSSNTSFICTSNSVGTAQWSSGSGVQGATGPQGATGADGATGAQGATGADGGQVNSITSSDGNIDINSTDPVNLDINLYKFANDKLLSDTPSTYPNGYSYGLNAGAGDFPDSYGTYQTFKANNDTGYQIFTATNSSRQWLRTITSSNTWGSFNEITPTPSELSVTSSSVSVTESIDYVFVDYTTTGPVTLTISDDWVNGRHGDTLIVKDSGFNAGLNNITIITESSQLIDGITEFVMDSNAEAITIYNRGGTLYLY